MRAISLWQPWASAIACGFKLIETRGWQTHYRGTIAIHAAKTREAADAFLFDDTVREAFAGVGITEIGQLPFGAIVATARLVTCTRVERLAPAPLEKTLGDFAPGRWGWALADVQRLTTPMPWRGAQGFFEVPDAALL